MTKVNPGRSILLLTALVTAFGGFIADFNATHLFNPAWPAHARFHDAQTVVLGLLLGLLGLYYLLRDADDPQADLGRAALLPALFWISQTASFLFPGTGGLEAEFPNRVPQLAGIWMNERVASISMLLLQAMGLVLARRRLG
jgi:hypothetical protein